MSAKLHRKAAENRISRPHVGKSRRGAGDYRTVMPREKAGFGGIAWQCGRDFAGACAARRQARPADRSNIVARCSKRLFAERLDFGAVGRQTRARPQAVEVAARASIAEHVQAMLAFRQMGVPVFDYGNNIRQVAKDEGVPGAFDFPGFVPAYIRPLFCRGIGPFRWAALSGDPEDIFRTDARVKELIPEDRHLHHWLEMAKERIAFQGLPARICWVGLGQRHRLGLAFNEMVAKGELKAPIVIGRDHLDSGSVASPN